MSQYTEAVDAKYVTRRIYDNAKLTVGLLEDFSEAFPGLDAKIRPILAAANVTLESATEADVEAYEKLRASIGLSDHNDDEVTTG